ncbi:MAG TPA: hypothetical protein DEP84_17230, partial [Chloroflexi bacterium]|nr:hypothetical protein [Chloroflexota bacterium]
MSRELLLGVDVGTTQIKAGLFGLDGRPLAIASEGYRLSFDAASTTAEQDPSDWWTATVRALRRVVAGSNLDALLALSVGGQGPTVVALDGALKPVHPALTWLDRRAKREWQLLSELSGQPLPPHAYVPKVCWLKTERPDVYAATTFFSQAWDFVAAQLIEELIVTTAPGIAPWADELLGAAGLDAAKFPPLRRFGSPIGRVTEAAARVTGLPAGLPVVGGTSDFFEGLLGSGAVQPGVACDNGGTSQSVNVCWDAPL